MKNQSKEKKLLLERLHKTPIIQFACEQTGVARATFYRWRKEDPEFNKDVASALKEGSDFVCDLAESQLLSAIKDKNMTAIIFWLKNHSQIYTDKLKIDGNITTKYNVLTPEQEKNIKKALKLASLAIKRGKENVRNKS
jgi:hypothetical protein